MKRAISLFTAVFLIAAAVFLTANLSTADEAACCITFKVVDVNGNPVPNTVVEVQCQTCAQLFTCTTGANGKCTICNYPAGSYTVTAKNRALGLSGHVNNIDCATIPSLEVTIVVQ
jgi:hypothetical protein